MTRTLAPGDLNLGHNLNGALVLRRLNETDSMSVSQRGVTGARHVWAVGHLAPKHAVMDAAVGRRGRALDRLARQGMYVVAMELTIATPLAIGFGGGGAAVDTSLTVHPTYGCPYLPGTGLKGAARSASTVTGTERGVIAAVFGSATGAEIGPDASAEELDGDQVAVGGVTFIDALPAGRLSIERAVLTPHYQPYYAGAVVGGAPAQPGAYHQPIPVEFLTIIAGTFHTAIVGMDRTLVDMAAGWLADAAQDYGLGAKTSSGFGYFNAGRIRDEAS